MAAALRGVKPRPREAFRRKPTAATAAVASLYSAESARQDLSILIIGERTNTNGSNNQGCLDRRGFRRLVAMGLEQVKEGSHVVDVCVDYVGSDGVPDMTAVISILPRKSRLR